MQDAPVRIRLLGGFGVLLGETPVPESAWRLQKAKALVKLLALAPGHRLARDQVLDLLWPDFEPEAATNNLYRTLTAARRALAPAATLALQGGALTLEARGPLEIDVERFESLADLARRSGDAVDWEAALVLYTGELLPEDRYEDWVAARREALQLSYRSLLLAAAASYRTRGDQVAAIGALQRLVADDPLHEPAHVALMRLYALAGQRAQAARQYQQLQDALARELDAEPEPATRRLHADILTGRFPPPAALDEPRAPAAPSAAPAGQSVPAHTLPAQLTSFVGRERDVAELRELLAPAPDRPRLVTLTGIGGGGKTRLALAVAEALAPEYPDGVYWVELASLADPALMARTVADVLSVREQPGQPLDVTIAAALRSRRALLLLDNCEQIVDGVARFAGALLSSCPELRVLATSREALRLPGEVAWRVPPLDLPAQPAAAGDQQSPKAAARSAAVALFVDRARARQPGFALTATNAGVVAEIVRRLDGLPLAIELAAARVRVLPPEQMARRLDDALRLLTGGSRTAPTRQQTLRATLDWSYRLLDEEERQLFRQLAVFAGGWSLDAAEAVNSGQWTVDSGQNRLPSTETLDTLERLADKSLVQIEAADDAAWYRLLEPVRQYALEELVASGEEAAVRARHAAYYLAAAERAAPEWIGPQQEAWPAWLAREGDNLRAALAWARGDGGDAAVGLRLAAALWRGWEVRGQLAEARASLTEFLALAAQASGAAVEAARLVALNGLAMLAYRHGDYDRVDAVMQEALTLARARGDAAGEAEALTHGAGAVLRRGDFDRALALYEGSLTVARAGGDRWGTAAALNGLGLVAEQRGDFSRAAMCYGECLAIYRERRDTRGTAKALNNLACVVRPTDATRATALSEESLALFRQLGDRWGIATALQNLADIARERGDIAGAIPLYREGLDHYQAMGNRLGTFECLEGLAEVYAFSGRHAMAARLYGATMALREAIGAPLAPIDLARHERHLTFAREGLGAADYACALAVGRAMSLEAAVAEAVAGEVS